MAEQNSEENVQHSEPASDDSWAGRLLKAVGQDLKAAEDSYEQTKRELDAAEKDYKRRKDEKEKSKTLELCKKAIEKLRRVEEEFNKAKNILHSSESILNQRGSSLLELQERKAPTEGEEVKTDGELQALNRQIAEALERAEEQVNRNRDKLTDAEHTLAETRQEIINAQGNYLAEVEELKKANRAVFEVALTLNKKAVVLPWKRLKIGILNLYTLLISYGKITAGLGYVYAVVLGATYEFVFYYGEYGLYIFDYATTSDFFLSGSKLVAIPLICILVLSFSFLLIGLYRYLLAFLFLGMPSGRREDFHASLNGFQ